MKKASNCYWNGLDSTASGDQFLGKWKRNPLLGLRRKEGWGDLGSHNLMVLILVFIGEFQDHAFKVFVVRRLVPLSSIRTV